VHLIAEARGAVANVRVTAALAPQHVLTRLYALHATANPDIQDIQDALPRGDFLKDSSRRGHSEAKTVRLSLAKT
jgi:hypothetical protein